MKARGRYTEEDIALYVSSYGPFVASIYFSYKSDDGTIISTAWPDCCVCHPYVPPLCRKLAWGEHLPRGPCCWNSVSMNFQLAAAVGSPCTSWWDQSDVRDISGSSKHFSRSSGWTTTNRVLCYAYLSQPGNNVCCLYLYIICIMMSIIEDRRSPSSYHREPFVVCVLLTELDSHPEEFSSLNWRNKPSLFIYRYPAQEMYFF